MSKSEVKTWSVSQLKSDFCPKGYLLSGPGSLQTGQHVVLKSDYQALKKENEELKDKLKKADQDHYNIAWELEHKEYMLKVLTEALHNPGKKNKVE